jgi:hypothetical protein
MRIGERALRIADGTNLAGPVPVFERTMHRAGEAVVPFGHLDAAQHGINVSQTHLADRAGQRGRWGIWIPREDVVTQPGTHVEGEEESEPPYPEPPTPPLGLSPAHVVMHRPMGWQSLYHANSADWRVTSALNLPCGRRRVLTVGRDRYDRRSVLFTETPAAATTGAAG